MVCRLGLGLFSFSLPLSGFLRPLVICPRQGLQVKVLKYRNSKNPYTTGAGEDGDLKKYLHPHLPLEGIWMCCSSCSNNNLQHHLYTFVQERRSLHPHLSLEGHRGQDSVEGALPIRGHGQEVLAVLNLVRVAHLRGPRHTTNPRYTTPRYTPNMRSKPGLRCSAVKHSTVLSNALQSCLLSNHPSCSWEGHKVL